MMKQIQEHQLTTDVSAESLQGSKMPFDTLIYLQAMIDELGVDEGIWATFDYQDCFIESIILHTLETVRGAERRGLLDDLTIAELKEIVMADTINEDY